MGWTPSRRHRCAKVARALEALVGRIFSEGLGDPKAVRDATTPLCLSHVMSTSPSFRVLVGLALERF
jgi:hypothetical protein